jgi:hypothetical protein
MCGGALLLWSASLSSCFFATVQRAAGAQSCFVSLAVMLASVQVMLVVLWAMLCYCPQGFFSCPDGFCALLGARVGQALFLLALSWVVFCCVFVGRCVGGRLTSRNGGDCGDFGEKSSYLKLREVCCLDVLSPGLFGVSVLYPLDCIFLHFFNE